MAKTLENMRGYVRMTLDESSPADWTDNQIDESLNYSYHEMVTLITEVYEDYYIKTDTLDTIASQQEYDTDEGVPTDMFKLARVEINYDVDGDATPSRAKASEIEAVLGELANTNLGVTTNSRPIYYLFGRADNLKLGFIPVPDKAGTDAIKLWYTYTVSDMSDDDDRPDIPYEDRYARLICYGALADLLDKGQQESAAADNYLERFEVGMERMKQQLKERLADGPRGVTNTSGENPDFTEGGL